jgi:hypothetical protein
MLFGSHNRKVGGSNPFFGHQTQIQVRLLKAGQRYADGMTMGEARLVNRPGNWPPDNGGRSRQYSATYSSFPGASRVTQEFHRQLLEVS